MIGDGRSAIWPKPLARFDVKAAPAFMGTAVGLAAAAGRAAFDAMITQQAQIIAYIDDYKLLMIATLVVIPLLIVFKKASDGGGKDHTIAVE
jgi:DHA2 family multidrug resistance protein